MKVHPAAALFPMLPPDEFDALAESIKREGLAHPILTTEIADEDGELVEVIVDGRNREAACKKAGVEPRFERINGADVLAVIMRENIARRHMSKGARAMAVAMLYPQSERGRGKKDAALKGAEIAGFSQRLLQDARFVLRIIPETAKLVVAGKPLDEAVKEAQTVDARQNSEEATLARLRVEAPDLAALYDEKRIPLSEAVAAAAQRKQDIEDRKAYARRSLATLMEFVSWVNAIRAGRELGEPCNLDSEVVAAIRNSTSDLEQLFLAQGGKP